MDKAEAIVKDMQTGTGEPGIAFLKFADVEIPEFKEVRNKDYILYGKDNLYPQYLTYLYGKSAKHAAIINGKTKYIYGGGFTGSAKTLPAVNRDGETWNDIGKKIIKDGELYGGARLIVIWNVIGSKVAEIFHVEFEKIRVGKDGGYWYKFNWADLREEPQYFAEYDPENPKGVQVFAYNEYRPGSNIYPLPEYLACNNYIETDIEISKFHLSSIKNGMMPSKAIEFFIGDPPDEKKREIERRFERKFSGAENAGKFVMIFNTSKDKSVNITDLSASELDKQFDILNKTCQQEIFTGHQVTSPMLFGIKEEGQLGGATELKTSYEIFINTYAKPKQEDYEKIANYFSAAMGQQADLYLKQVDPVGIVVTDSMVQSALTTDEIREMLGLAPADKPADSAAQKTINALSSMSPLVATKILDNLNRNEIRSLAGLPPVAGGDTIPDALGGAAQGTTIATDGLTDETTAPVVNSTITNLTAKQHQQVMRIIRQYSKEQITKEAATVMLKTGYGLSDSDIASLLGIEPEVDTEEMSQQFSAEEDELIQMFSACGDLKRDYHIIKSKKVKFSSDEEAFEDEMNFHEQSFKGELTNAESDILRLISKDKHITPEVIAEALNTTPEYVTAKIGKLVKKGLLKTSEQQIGEDTQIEHELTTPLDEITQQIADDNPTIISIKYSYEGPEDSRNRPFCAKLLQLNRLYSRAEIESISQRVGYSVFDRRGGFWRHKGTDITTPYCRHTWMSRVVVKKGDDK